MIVVKIRIYCSKMNFPLPDFFEILLISFQLCQFNDIKTVGKKFKELKRNPEDENSFLSKKQNSIVIFEFLKVFIFDCSLSQ